MSKQIPATATPATSNLPNTCNWIMWAALVSMHIAHVYKSHKCTTTTTTPTPITIRMKTIRTRACAIWHSSSQIAHQKAPECWFFEQNNNEKINRSLLDSRRRTKFWFELKNWVQTNGMCKCSANERKNGNLNRKLALHRWRFIKYELFAFCI